MWGVGKMANIMVREHSLGLMEGSILGNGKIIENGTEECTTKTEKSYSRL